MIFSIEPRLKDDFNASALSKAEFLAYRLKCKDDLTTIAASLSGTPDLEIKYVGRFAMSVDAANTDAMEKAAQKLPPDWRIVPPEELEKRRKAMGRF